MVGSLLPKELLFRKHYDKIYRLREKFHRSADRLNRSLSACPKGGGLLRCVPRAGQHPGQRKAATSTSGGVVVAGEGRRTGGYEGSREVRPGADRTAVWFGGSGTVADSGAHPRVDPALQGNRRQSWRSFQNQPTEGASGASPGGRVILSIDQEPDRHRAGNHSTNNLRGGSGGVIRPLALAVSTNNY